MAFYWTLWNLCNFPGVLSCLQYVTAQGNICWYRVIYERMTKENMVSNQNSSYCYSGYGEVFDDPKRGTPRNFQLWKIPYLHVLIFKSLQFGSFSRIRVYVIKFISNNVKIYNEVWLQMLGLISFQEYG